MAPLTTITFLFAISADLVYAAHAGFHVQFPWMTRGRPSIDRYVPFCGEILHNPQRYSRRSRGFLSFSGHPGDLVTVLYTRHRVPREREDFPFIIMQDVPIQPSGQLCVNVTIPFETAVDEIGVMYFEAKDSKTGNWEYYCSDVKMANMMALPEDHPAMCAANNETLIPMPDEYL